MRVLRSRVLRRAFGLKRAVTGALGTWTERRIAILRLETGDGGVGHGEAAPLPGYSDDTLDEAVAELEALGTTRMPFAVDLQLAPIASIREVLAASGLCTPSARFALEAALLDLAEKALGIRPAALLRGSPEVTTVERNVLLAPETLDEVVLAAAALWERGFRTFKLKVGVPGRWDREVVALRRLRSQLGPSARLRLDANGAWSLDEARVRLAELAGANLAIEYVEQPVSPKELPSLGWVPVSVAADESLREREVADSLLCHPHSCRFFVLKPMVLGGVLPCLDLARRARAAGLEVVVTGLFDGPVAERVCAELAMALAPLPACGIGSDESGPLIGPGPCPRPAHEHPSLSLLDAALDSPNRIAVHVAERPWTFAELAAPVVAMATALREAGAGGHPVAMTPRPTLETLIRLYALFELGTPAVLLHPRFTPSERAEHLALVPDALDLDTLDPSPKDLEGQAPVCRPTWLTPLLDDAKAAAIVFTSGTSGRPKGVELSRAALVASAEASAAHLGWQDEEGWLLSLPPAHVGGLSVVTRCLLARRAVVLEPRPGPLALAEALDSPRVTRASLVPTQLERLFEHCPTWRAPARLRAVLLGGAGARPAVLAEAGRRGVPILSTYGLSETASQVATQRPGDPPGTVFPLPGVKVRVVDERIQVAGPTLMTRYIPGDVLTSPWTEDGWLKTGDWGRFDEEGRLVVIGRADDVIVTGGEKVDPRDVEEAIEQCPGVGRALVFGVADPTWGELVAAAIVPLAGAAPSAEVVAAGCALRLAPFKQPRLMAIVEQVPQTSAGKPDRRGAASVLAGVLQPVRFMRP